jgi:putative PIN family toxin of toxin-antitoxin system
MIVVLDSNVWVSAFLSGSGFPGEVVNACLRGVVTLAVTEHLLTELERVLEYDRLSKALDERGVLEHARATVALLRETVPAVAGVPPKEQWIHGDPDDDWVIQCALTANADYIVSGDRHLLSLGRVGSIEIVTPADFVAGVLAKQDP